MTKRLEPIPRSALHLLQYLNIGRKFGAPDSARVKHVKLTRAYDMQKIDVMIGATTSRLPIKMQLCEMIHVPITAIRGSSPYAEPYAKGLSTGYILSRAMACSTREPPNSDPRADEKAEMRIPVMTTYCDSRDASWNTFRSLICESYVCVKREQWASAWTLVINSKVAATQELRK